jgi:Recombination endonuclease VII
MASLRGGDKVVRLNLLFPHGMSLRDKHHRRDALRVKARYQSGKTKPKKRQYRSPESEGRRKAYYKEWLKRPKAQDSLRESQWRRHGIHGFSGKDYAALLQQQNGVCAICLRPPTTRVSLSVDHDHESGHVRGLLCGFCNRRLLIARNTAEVLSRAADYLRRGKTK